MRAFSRLFIVFFLSACFFGCKKDGGSSSTSILGTWTFVSEQVRQYTNGAITYDKTYTVTDGDYNSIRFDGNNTGFVVYSDNSSSTLTYTYDAQNKLLITDDDAYTVPTLTSSSLVMYSANPESTSPTRSEIIFTWKR